MRLWPLLLVLFVLFGCNQRPRKNVAFYNNIGSEPVTLNPITSSDIPAREVHSFVLESLLNQNLDTYEWEPALAESWEISDDNKEFTFKLREGVKWHDGKPLTVEDVKFSFDVIFDDRFNAAHKRPYYESIESPEIVDERTIKFRAKNTYFQNFDVVAGMFILPKHFYDAGHKKSVYNKQLIGTGPYYIALYNKGNRIVLEKNPDWWDKNSIQYNFPKVVLRFVGDKNIEIEMLKKGSLDFMAMRAENFVKQTDGPKWGKEVHKVKVTNSSPKGYNFIGWNLTHPILKSKTVRKALYHLVDRKEMIEKFEYNYSVPAVGPIYPSSPYASPDLKPVEFNPKKALEMLRADGWSDTDGDNILDKVIDGKKTKFSITILEPWEGFGKYHTIFKEDAKKAGVEINIKIVEWNSFVKLLDERKFEAVRLAWSASVDWDPKQIWHSSSIKGGSNFVGYNNPEADKLIDEARMIMDREERIKKLRKVEKMIVDDAPYVWFSYKETTMYGHTDRIKKPKDTFKYGIGTSYWDFKSNMRQNI